MMESNDVITAWGELTETSALIDSANITSILCGICEDDLNFFSEGVQWNEDDSMIVAMEFFYYNQEPPLFEELFQPLLTYLCAGEYLVFEVKHRFGHRPRSLVQYLITHEGIFSCDSLCMVHSMNRFMPIEDDTDEDPVNETMSL